MRSARPNGDSVDDRPDDEERPESQDEDPTPELAEELLRNPARSASVIRSRPELLQSLLAGYQAVGGGFTEFLTANDRSASRVKDTADRLIESINAELARGGLTADERRALVETQAQVLQEVRGSEKDIREANERSFTKLAGMTVAAAVGAVALGYLVKEGKLPLSLPRNG